MSRNAFAMTATALVLAAAVGLSGLLWRWRRQFDDGRGYDARRHLNARQGHTAGWECSAASWVHDGRRQILLFRTSLDRPYSRTMERRTSNAPRPVGR